MKPLVHPSIPVYSSGISAGFPSPAADFEENNIDLNQLLIRHPYATFFGRVKGDSMINAGIADGDLLVIDKSLNPSNGSIAVCFVDGAFTVKRILIQKDCCYLMPENDHFSPIKVTEDNDFIVWGIVTAVIKQFVK
jgi:DNA polymerase V